MSSFIKQYFKLDDKNLFSTSSPVTILLGIKAEGASNKLSKVKPLASYSNTPLVAVLSHVCTIAFNTSYESKHMKATPYGTTFACWGVWNRSSRIKQRFCQANRPLWNLSYISWKDVTWMSFRSSQMYRRCIEYLLHYISNGYLKQISIRYPADIH